MVDKGVTMAWYGTKGFLTVLVPGFDIHCFYFLGS